jgi:hypothetical protein
MELGIRIGFVKTSEFRYATETEKGTFFATVDGLCSPEVSTSLLVVYAGGICRGTVQLRRIACRPPMFYPVCAVLRCYTEQIHLIRRYTTTVELHMSGLTF